MEERTGSFKPIKNQRGKFNAVDFLILLLMVIFVAVILISMGFVDWFNGTDEVTLEYTVEIQNVPIEFINNIKVGDRVYESTTETLLGNVVDVDNTIPYNSISYDAEIDGMVSREIPDMYNIRVTVVSEAEFAEGVGYSVGGCRVSVGTGLRLRFPSFLCSAYCIKMTEA